MNAAIAGACSQAEFSAALLDPARPCPDGLVAANGSDPAVRLAVHRNNVVASLVDALTETFPVVRDLVGEDFFRAMAALFVREHPPRTRLLAQYGEALPAFIEGFPPAQSVPYLADVARLEFERVRAYRAADANPLPAEQVVDALDAHGRIDDLRLTFHPSISLVVSGFAVVSIWAAHQDGTNLETVDPGVPESALVCRNGLDVLVLRLPPGSAEFLNAALRGLDVGESARVAAAASAGFDLTITLALLSRYGVITSIHIPSTKEQ